MKLQNTNVIVIVDVFLTEITNYILNHIIGLLEEGASVRILTGQITKDNNMKEVAKYDLYDKAIRHNINNNYIIAINILIAMIKSLFDSNIRSLVIKLMSSKDLYKSYGWKYVVKALSILRFIDPSEVDIVHSHSLLKSYEYLFLKQVYGVSLVTTFHGLPTKYVAKLQKDKINRVFQNGDLFLVNTEFAKKQIINLGCEENKIKIIPQGTKIENFPRIAKKHVPIGQLNIMSLCRLSYDKGLVYLVDAIEMLQKRYPYILYRMIGSGPQEQELAEIIRSKNLQNTIIMCGRLNFEKVIDVFLKSDIFVLPSIKSDDEDCHEETQAVVIQEAQCVGLPVISTKVGGIPECNLDEETALLVNDRNSVAISRAIIRLKEDNSLYEKLVRSGYINVLEKYERCKVISKIADAYLEVVNKDIGTTNARN